MEKGHQFYYVCLVMAVTSAFTHTESRHYVKATERSVLDQHPPAPSSGC